MASLKELTKKEIFFYLGFFVFLVGLVGIRILISIGPALMLISALLQPKPLKETLQFLMNTYWHWLAFFFLLLLSFWGTPNSTIWIQTLNNKIVWILFPIIFSLTSIKKELLLIILKTFVGVVFMVALATYINYLNHKEFWDSMIKESKNIAVITGAFHIHFGIMMAMASWFSLYIFNYSEGIGRFIFLVLGIFTFFLLHLLAYRTGILASYLTIGCWIIYLFIKKRKIITGLALIFIGIITALMLYNSNKTIQLKVENTKNDIQQFYSGKDINHYSISMRLAAWSNAWEIFKNNIWVGVGIPNMKEEMHKKYQEKSFGLTLANQVLIHNQFLHTLVTTGIIGGIIFMLMLYAGFTKGFPLYSLGVGFIGISGFSMLVDSYLELQVGMNLFIFFYCLFRARITS